MKKTKNPRVRLYEFRETEGISLRTLGDAIASRISGRAAAASYWWNIENGKQKAISLVAAVALEDYMLEKGAEAITPRDWANSMK